MTSRLSRLLQRRAELEAELADLDAEIALLGGPARTGAVTPPVPRTALVSDIHGNLRGLQAVLDDAAAAGCGRVVCLGDLVDGGDENAEVVRLVRDRGMPCVVGNHDTDNDLHLPDDVRTFLRGLPEQLVEGDVLFTHISPRRRQAAVRDAVEAWNALEDCPHRITFVGHVHVPMIFGRNGGQGFAAAVHECPPGRPVRLDPGDRYLVVVGAVGYPRDGIRKPRYAIWDPAAGTVENREVDGHVLPLAG